MLGIRKWNTSILCGRRDGIFEGFGTRPLWLVESTDIPFGAPMSISVSGVSSRAQLAIIL